MDAHQLKVAPIKLLFVSRVHVSVIHTGKDEDVFMSAMTCQALDTPHDDDPDTVCWRWARARKSKTDARNQ